MAVATTTSANGALIVHEGTAQEVIDTIEALPLAKVLEFGHNGTAYFALVRPTA